MKPAYLIRDNVLVVQHNGSDLAMDLGVVLRNLAIAGALCEAFEDGERYARDVDSRRRATDPEFSEGPPWRPGCALRPAP